MALTAIDFDKIIIDKIMMATATDRTTGELYFMCDQIKNGSIDNTGDKSMVTGMGGVNLAALKKNKATKVTWDNGYVISTGIATQAGTEVQEASVGGEFIVPSTEIITLTGTTNFTVAQIPVGSTGSEIKYIYKANADGTQGKKYSVAATASATEFSVAAATKTVTLPTTGFAIGDRVIVIYNYKVAIGKKITNEGTSFAKDCKLVLDVLCRSACDTNVTLLTKFVFPYFSIDDNFKISVADTPEAHNFSGDVIQDACSSTKTLWDWFIVE